MGWKIKNVFYGAIFIVMILLGVHYVYSVCIGEGASIGGNMDACLTVSPTSVSGRGPSSTSISGEVENKNWFCTISCLYRTSQGKSGNVGSIAAGASEPFTISIEIPASGSSPQTISIYADCSGSGIFCGFSGTIPESVTLTYTYCGDNSINDGETCSNCPLDAGCQSGYVCQNGQCIERCGNGIQDSGETCSSCPTDVTCPAGTRCEASQCVTYCGNYQKDAGETCSSCPTDVQCQSGYICQSGECIKAVRCGDSQCDSSESCLTCPSDCGRCPPVCGDGACERTESCSSCSKDCGECPKQTTTSPISSKSTSNELVQQQNAQKSSSSSSAAKQNQVPYAVDTRMASNNQNTIIIIILIAMLVAVGWIVYKFITKRKHVKVHQKEQKIKHCRKCGFKLNPDDVYCENCGKKIK